jgi:cysteinyl-tRNA synthetase
MRGRPGWHIECSAMSMDILGETFDIHGGGIDLQFPHHEDEIAQSEMATGKPFANYWMHNGHIRVNEEKMSKSLGNFFTIKDMLAKFNPLVIRYFLISSHYRMPVEFSDDLLEQSRNGLERLHDFMRRLRSYSGYGGQSIANKFAHVLQSFDSSMEDDFEISKGLAAIFDFVKELNGFMDSGKLSTSDANAAIAVMNGFDSVLGVLKVEKVGEDSAEIEKLIKERNDARDSKDFARSDEIRDELKASGIILEDRTGGTIWKREL